MCHSVTAIMFREEGGFDGFKRYCSSSRNSIFSSLNHENWSGVADIECKCGNGRKSNLAKLYLKLLLGGKQDNRNECVFGRVEGPKYSSEIKTAEGWRMSLFLPTKP